MGGGNFGGECWRPIVTDGEFDAACFHITLGNLVSIIQIIIVYIPMIYVDRVMALWCL